MHFATKRDRFLIGIAGFGNMFNGALYPGMLVILQNARPAGGGKISYRVALIIMGLATVVNFFFGFIAAAAAEYAAERQVKRMKLTFLDHLLSQEMAYFDKFDALTLATRLNFQTAAVRRSLGQKLAQMGLSIGFILCGVEGMYTYAPKQTAKSLALFPLIIITGWWAAHVDKRADIVSQQAFASAARVAHEALSNIKTVKAFALEPMMISRFATSAKEALNANVRASLIAGFATGLHWAMILGTFGIALLIGVRQLIKHKATTDIDDTTERDELFNVFANLVLIAFAITKVFPGILIVGKAKYSLRQILQLYARQSKINPSQSGGVETPINGDFVFQDVLFKYTQEAEKHVFKSLNLHIPAGKTTAIVGASGSGKSTIVQLIERFYDVTDGLLTVDGVPITDYNVTALRAQIALVSQEPRLFSDTIAANIGCAKADCTRDEIIECAKQANAHDFIMQFPQGYDTWVGEGGGQLSGGQKQRIAIARALLKDPKVLILDEATSALDNVSEKIVQETCDKIASQGSRTTIVIAHRLSTVRSADKIVVLDNPNGEGAMVAEEGTHEELLRVPNGLYAALVAAQTGGISGEDETKWTLRSSSTLSQDLSRRASSLLRQQSRFRQSSVVSKQIDWDVDQLPGRIEKPRHYRRTMHLVHSEWYWMVLGVVCSVLTGFLWPFVGWSVAGAFACYFYDDTNKQRSQANKYCLIYCVVAVAALICISVARACSGRMAATLTERMRIYFFEVVIKKTVSFFDSPLRSPGALVNIMGVDVRQLGGWGGANLAAYTATILVFIVAVIISLTTNWTLGLITLGGTLVLAPVSWINSSLMRQGSVEFGRHQINKELKQDCVSGVMMSRAEAVMSEAILNIRTVTAYNLQGVMAARYKEAILDDFKRGKRAALMAGVTWGLSQCTIMGIIVLCIWYAIRLYERNILDIWSLLRAILTLLMAAFNMGAAFTAMSEDSKARESATRIYDIIDERKAFDEYSQTGLHVQDIDSINFDHVAFRYMRRPDLPIYRDVTFTIPKGAVVALVGGSGCGKSTAVQLIQHLYAVGEGFEESDRMGSLLLNGRNLGEYNIQSLRQQIGVVSQEPSLFWGTIEENIGYGKAGASPEDISEAAKAANALDIINRLPEGIHTEVGRGGAKLSGGQKQRIAIARALLRNPKLLILDEATSALDAESEKVVQATLDALIATRNFTTLIIAHRLSTIRKADVIVVLANSDLRGSVVAEIGTHQDLMKIPNGVYKGLVRIAENK
eukprot:Blabericola_migrator_1__995@NODE_124_length_13360_cov_167_053938_g110_i0_p2_GENE_NODE_124_length_13360_cov_167_053938_g110_i0NODE_124_length_13360_cov_167_053938_g110_i0_p2_ORF_typecomplete_len1252_score238_56ABC_tran/PF00005_27/1_7e39ABC_tran/PF00005_27/1e03ABC_tran/PF00005_27/6_7e38ABC_membrane/PF00664_23/6_1e32ABC_membrane/PF00664_23/1_9e37SMC_N/PF02463_19/1_4SMC_N/PF02463_19/4_8e05SMC_N/PF02463_19/4_3e02SMC_N/PF02463_19/0_00065AAA_21/PF13304_6/0_0017AAA_21/PF13304_6/0_016AAA_29/PF13555_6/0_0